MRKSFLAITITCVSILAVSFAQQSQASQPAPQPAQTPAAGAPASTCPASPTAPTITGTVNAGTTEIKGTATAPVAGCPSEIQIHLMPAGTVLPLTADSNPTVGSDGTFSVKLQTGLTAGQAISAAQAFASTNGTAAPQAQALSATVAVPAAPAPAAVAAQGGPVIAGTLREGSNAISGTTPQLPATAAAAAAGTNCSAQVEVHDVSGTGRLLQMSGGASRGTVGTDNTFNLTLQEPFMGGQKIRVDEIMQNCQGPAVLPSAVVDVVVPGDWGRVKGYFTSGILLSQNQNSFSQSSLFLGFNLDKTWRMPGYYHQVKKNTQGATRMSHWPGINTFFDVRLTSTPVSACNLPSGASGTSGDSCASPSPTPTPAAAAVVRQAADATPSPTPLDTFLSQRKTARFTVGTYFPFTITSWTYNNRPNALFIAPLAKVGFDTPVGDLTQIQTPTTTTPAGATITPTAVNQANFYNFWGYGGRIGHYALTNSRNEAPELISYLDVIFGPYSNLETLIIPEQGPTTPVKRTRLYRLGLEGVMKIPSTPLILGFSANIGQESLGLGPHTIVQRAGDDLRFLFGARFDAAKLMSVISKVAP
jgi:hypothetical protein